MAQLVVADTSPINYLTQIGHIDLLPRTFKELAARKRSNPNSPLQIRRNPYDWITAPPAWIEIHGTASLREELGLNVGETAAITLADFPERRLVVKR